MLGHSFVQQFKQLFDHEYVKKYFIWIAVAFLIVFLLMGGILYRIFCRRRQDPLFRIEIRDPAVRKISGKMNTLIRRIAGNARVPFNSRMSLLDWFRALPDEMQTDLLKKLLEHYEQLRYRPNGSDPESLKTFQKLLAQYRTESEKKH